MQQLLGNKAATADQSFFRQLFLQRLPPNVRMVLASTKDNEDLESLASLADKVVEVASPAVNTVQNTELSTDIAGLKKLVTSSLSATRHFHSPRHCTPSPAPPDKPTDLCWYHARFAEKATKCTKPCSWLSENVQADR